MKWLATLASALFLQGCTLFGVITVEEPAYQVSKSDEEFEIREYGKLLVVETEVDSAFDDAGDEAFSPLFDYITGANVLEESISMTAPVTLQVAKESKDEMLPFMKERSEGGWKMSFVLPSEYTMETAPKPTNPRVFLREIPAKKIAAVTFSGRWSRENFEEYSNKLASWLEANNITATSPARVAAYNPPWAIPGLRRNEIHMEIQ